MTTLNQAAPATLSALDRCDRCGARAYLKAILPFGELAFCGHHGRKMLPALREQAVTIIDETDLIATN